MKEEEEEVERERRREGGKKSLLQVGILVVVLILVGKDGLWADRVSRTWTGVGLYGCLTRRRWKLYVGN